jgi:rare lipoprotein A
MPTRSLGFSAFLITAVLTLGACARAVVTAPPERPPGAAVTTPPEKPPGAVVTPPPERPPSAGTLSAEHKGVASWYGRQHQGKPTASGEIFEMRDLTAAHRTLPMGTRLMVTNLENGRVVEVRINDRGPFVDGRVLDLSYGAARLLGAAGAGVVRVSFRIVSLPDVPVDAGPTAAAAGEQFSLHLAAFTSRARAENLRRSLEREGSKPTISEWTVGDQRFYRVHLGPYPDRGAADSEAKRLAERGYFSVVVVER